MQQKVVVVVHHSQSKSSQSHVCWHCHQELFPTGAIPSSFALFCGSCQAVQDLPLSQPSPFEILGVAERLVFDEGELRTRFYDLSKKLHPDRYLQHPFPAPQYALRWTTALNRAYGVLKNPRDRAQLLIAPYLAPAGQRPSSAIPTDLAETYFEIQDLLSENNLAPLIPFQTTLQDTLKQSESLFQKLAQQFDATADKSSLANSIKTLLDREKYLQSMLEDIERKLSRKS